MGRRSSVSPVPPAPTRRRKGSSLVTCVPAVMRLDQWELPTLPAAQVRGHRVALGGMFGGWPGLQPQLSAINPHPEEGKSLSIPHKN